MQTISSARPRALAAYAEASGARGGRLSHEARLLADALGRFRAGCTEYHVAAADGIPEAILAAEGRWAELDAWVRAVAADFAAADGGGVGVTLEPYQLAPVALSPAVKATVSWMAVGMPLAWRIAGVGGLIEVGGLPGQIRLLLAVGLPGAQGLIGATISAQAWVAEIDRWLVGRLGELEQGFAAACAALEAGMRAAFSALGLLVAEVIDILALAARTGGKLYAIAAWAGAQAIEAWVEAVPAILLQIQESILDAGWNGVALSLTLLLAGSNEAGERGGVLGFSLVTLVELPAFIALGLTAGGLIFAGEFAALPPDAADWILWLDHGFWNQGPTRTHELLIDQLTGQLDETIRFLAGVFDYQGTPRPTTGPGAEPVLDPRAGTLDVPIAEAIPPAEGYTGGPYAPLPSSLMDGIHRLISSYRGEQVSMAKIDQGEFVMAVNGLDMMNLASSPNGLNAVSDTGYQDVPELNNYYPHVKARVIKGLDRIPPGGILHLVGHSMGGGMLFMLLNDPELIAELERRDIRVGSAVTFGAVRPTNPNCDKIFTGAADGPLAGIVVRHYVDPDDRLAMNVGAGHNPEQYADIYFVDDGDLDGAQPAHTDYGRQHQGYSRLPAEAQVMPWVVNPEEAELYERTEPEPFEVIDAPPEQIIFA